MGFLTDYFEAIDIIALVAPLGLAAVAFSRRGGIWVVILCAVVAFWAAVRIFNILQQWSFLNAHRTQRATFPAIHRIDKEEMKDCHPPASKMTCSTCDGQLLCCLEVRL
ncbi:hypothetical protein [Chelatococcus asaccharovorans]|uniref:hypothetical protein n=1 Tax=Chelatococcus asaccharovorans TaxID=28210 RepID=UPI00224C67B6|nr:hypothetical protein [Chelatococcus asaccharovorans]CAH1669858.1 hypothetical protein CHELA17_61012 [Chelatococcus asaccharovorans]CAH1678721.1 hypothetical protein CHELA40_14608 [Chelatococcus asaccharovorans]